MLTIGDLGDGEPKAIGTTGLSQESQVRTISCQCHAQLGQGLPDVTKLDHQLLRKRWPRKLDQVHQHTLRDMDIHHNTLR